MYRSGSSRSSWRVVVVIAVVAAATAACVATQPTPSAHGSGQQPTPVSTAQASASAPTPTWTPPETPPTTPTIGAAPSGDWTSLSWIRVEGSLAAGYPKIPPGVPTTLKDGTSIISNEGPNVFLGAVKSGYLQLLWDPYQRTWTPWLSADALAWRQGPVFDLSAWARDFANWDKVATDADTRAACGITVDDFAQAANGIVVRAHFECEIGCGSAYESAQAWWTSTDALTWTPADLSSTFGKAGIATISGGANGFIGLTLNSKASWTSSEGHAWRKGTVPANAYRVSLPVSMNGGFVIAGVVRRPTAPPPDGGRCMTSPLVDLAGSVATVWWSKDGVTWTPQPLSAPTGERIVMSLDRIDDHTVIAVEDSHVADPSMDTFTYWLSRDGHTWTKMADWPLSAWVAIEGGDRGLIAMWGGPETTLHFTIDQDGSLHELAQSGEVPQTNYTLQELIGPVGLLVTDGTSFWLGVPSSS